jgi:hypothetical protein
VCVFSLFGFLLGEVGADNTKQTKIAVLHPARNLTNEISSVGAHNVESSCANTPPPAAA